MERPADDSLRLQRDPPEGQRAWHAARRHLRLSGSPDGCRGDRLSRISASGVDLVLGPRTAACGPSAVLSDAHLEDFANVSFLVAPAERTWALARGDTRPMACGLVAVGFRRARSRFRAGSGRDQRQGL